MGARLAPFVPRRSFCKSNLESVLSKVKRAKRDARAAPRPLEAQISVIANRVTETVRFDMLWKKAYVRSDGFVPTTAEETRKEAFEKVLREEAKTYGAGEDAAGGPMKAPLKRQYDDAVTKLLYERILRTPQFRTFYNAGAVNESLVDDVWKRLPEDVQRVLHAQPAESLSGGGAALKVPELRRESVLEKMAGDGAAEEAAEGDAEDSFWASSEAASSRGSSAYESYDYEAVPLEERKPLFPWQRRQENCRGKKQRRASHRAASCDLIDLDEVMVTNVKLLRQYINDAGMIKHRRETLLCNKCQKKVARTVRCPRPQPTPASLHFARRDTLLASCHCGCDTDAQGPGICAARLFPAARRIEGMTHAKKKKKKAKCGSGADSSTPPLSLLRADQGVAGHGTHPVHAQLPGEGPQRDGFSGWRRDGARRRRARAVQARVGRGMVEERPLAFSFFLAFVLAEEDWGDPPTQDLSASRSLET